MGENRDAWDTINMWCHVNEDRDHECRRRDTEKNKDENHTPPRACVSTMGTSAHQPRAKATHLIKLGQRHSGSQIRYAPTPSSFEEPHNFQKYDGNSNPKNWLEDYHLAMKAIGIS
jgi:hypothetical protein